MPRYWMRSLLLVTLAGMALAKSPPKPRITAPEGLVEVKVPGFERSFIRAATDLSSPRSVCITSGELTLAPDWPKKIFGRPIAASDLKRTEDGFNRAVREEFEMAFRNQGNYRLASGNADCQLRIVATVKDLYLNAPEPMTAARTKTYARSIGRLRMQVDVLDASGAVLLARAHGARTDPDRTWGLDAADALNEVNRVTEIDNLSFAHDAARRFAEYTRTRLLTAH